MALEQNSINSRGQRRANQTDHTDQYLRSRSVLITEGQVASVRPAFLLRVVFCVGASDATKASRASALVSDFKRFIALYRIIELVLVSRVEVEVCRSRSPSLY